MKNFGELFQGYLKDEELLSQLGPGVVQAMRIDSKNRRMELDVAFDKIVKRRVLFDVERKLQKSELNLSFVTIQPHFPEILFGGLLSGACGGASTPDRQPERHRQRFHSQSGGRALDGDLSPWRSGDSEKQEIR